VETFYGDRFYWSGSPQPGKEVLHLLGTLAFSTALLVVDRNVSTGWISSYVTDTRIRIVEWPGGEGAKAIAGLSSFAAAQEDWLDKNSVVVVAGGGSMLDFIGLCCGLMYRGLRYLSVPTSLIGLADAAYGGKTAVNHGAKNQLGMYHHPTMVYANPLFLDTLPERHLRSGMIEIVKLGIFFPDIKAAVADVLAGRRSAADTARMAARRKLELLADDPFEETDAAVLLYGHPFANSFESFASGRPGCRLSHGEAVALGISFSAWLSESAGGSGDRLAPELAAISEWVEPRHLAEQAAPPVSDFVALLGQDKYAARDVIRIPAIGDTTGFTTLPLAYVAEQYPAWLTWLGVNREPAPAPRTTTAPYDRPSRYIAGLPYDETVTPLRVTAADGPFLITSDGRRLLDWSTCLNVPLGHDIRLDTATLPMNAGNYRTDQRDALVARLVDIFPYLSGFQFRSSGTEAVEAALRYCHASVGTRSRMVVVEDCYHGLTLGAQALMGKAPGRYFDRTTLAFAALSHRDRMLAEFDRHLRSGPVVLWLEGVQGATLRRLPSEFLSLVADLQAEYPGRFVVVGDDMLASIRTGSWCSLGDVAPDILLGGKSWAAGFPFSFFGVKEWLREAAGDILGTTSYGGNPIACAYAVHTIERATGLLSRIQEVEATFRERFSAEALSFPELRRAEWHGMLFGVEARDADAAAAIARRAADNGLLVSRLDTVIRCSPPLDLNDDLLDVGLKTLLDSVASE
jgi:3-dehydroquinate synthetase/4-aminobutyrate aminotransferase-like enzyme